MKKDIINRSEPQNKILYEPGDPLFPPIDGRVNRQRAVRMLALAAALTVAVVICICIGVSAAGGEFDTSESTEPFDQTEQTDSSDSDLGDQPTERTEYPSDVHTEPSATPSTEDEQTYATQTSPSDEHTEIQTNESVLSMDISELEYGEHRIFNYTSKKVDVGGLLDRGFIYSEPANNVAPLVLIIHTHTSEEYAQSSDGRYKINSVVAAGERLAAVLNSRGVTTLHCTVIHDSDDTNAYLNARDTIKTMLKIYPTVKYVIDVHRMILHDADGNEMRTRTTLDGASQIRLTVSTDIKREGAWQDDVSLALAVRSELNGDNQSVCAPVVLSHGGYNGDMCRFFLMADVGSSCDSVGEAMKAAEKLGNAFADVVLEE